MNDAVGTAHDGPPPQKRSRLDSDGGNGSAVGGSGSIGGDLSRHMSSVVLIEVTSASPNYLQPWQMNPQQTHKGSGFIIEGQRIVTNFHVVENAIDVRLRKHGVARRWRGKVVVCAHDVDLAIVAVHEEEDGVGESFWKGTTPSALDTSLPSLQSVVSVVGFPTGGTTICVTQGVVSRIDCKNYRLGYTAAHNPGRLLVIQIDAAINPGNSGGPAFLANGNVAGVAFQGLGGQVDNIGYIIPSLLVQHFFSSLVVESPAAGTPIYTYPGVADIPFKIMELRNRSLRDRLKVAPEQTGVVVTKVSPIAVNAGLQLQEDDVIIAIDHKNVGDDFTVELRTSELLGADYLITCKAKGVATHFDCLRHGEPHSFEVVLRPLPHMMPRCHGFDCTPEYLIVGGLVFCHLTCPMLHVKKQARKSQALYNMINFEFVENFVTEELADEKHVVLIDILANSLNYGYSGHAWRVLDTVNGSHIKNLAQLAELYRGFKGEYFVLEFSVGGDKIVLAASQCHEIEEQIKRTHAIPCIASSSLAQIVYGDDGDDPVQR